MLPRLQAEEQLRTASSVGLGFGGGEEGKEHIKELQDMASGKVILPKEQRRDTGRQFAAMMGLPIRVHKKKE